MPEHSLSFATQWATPVRLRAALAVSLIAAGLVHLVQTLLRWHELFGSHDGKWSHQTDLMIHWSAGYLANTEQAVQTYQGRTLLHTYQAFFDLPPDVDYWSYIYPPPTLLLSRLLALTDFPLTAIWFIGGSLILFLLVAWLWQRSWGVLLAAAFASTWSSVICGQVSLLVAGFFGLFFWLLPRKPLLAGAVLGLMILKPQFALLMPILLIAAKEWRCVLGASLSTSLIILLSFAVDGIEIWKVFLTTGSQTATAHLGASWLWGNFATFFGQLAAEGTPTRIALPLHAAAALLASYLVIPLWHNKQVAYELKASAALLTALLLSPMSYAYDLPIALMALLPLLQLARQDRNSPLRTEIGLHCKAALLFVLPVYSLKLIPILILLLVLDLVRIGKQTAPALNGDAGTSLVH